jgi:type II secretory pathway component PulJ
MGRAKITSIDAPQAMTTTLQRFQHEAATALEELSQEIQRAVQWIQHDCKQYWNEQLRIRQQEVTEARVNLERHQMMTVGDYRPSCYDEKKALELAKRRLALARERIESVRHWSYAISHAVHEYKGGVGPLARWLETDLPRALAALEQMSTALESYVAIEPATADAGGSELASASRNPEDEELRPVDGNRAAGDGRRSDPDGQKPDLGALE